MKLLLHLTLTFFTGGVWLLVVFIQACRGKKTF